MDRSGWKVCVQCGAPVLDPAGRPRAQLYDEKLFNKTKILKLVQCDRWVCSLLFLMSDLTEES